MGALGIMFAGLSGIVAGAGAVWWATRRRRDAAPSAAVVAGSDVDRENRLLHQISELAAAVFWATGEGGEGLIYMSPSVRRVLGYEADDFSQGRMDWAEIVHPTDRERFLRELREWEEAGGQAILTMEYRMRRADGEVRWMRDVLTRVSDAHSGSVGFVGVAMDVTHEKETSIQAQELAEIVERAPDLMSIAEPDGTPLFTNPAGVRMLGVPDPPPPGSHISMGHPEWAWKIVKEQGIPGAIRDGVWMGETAFRTVEGREIPVHQVIVAHRDEQGNLRRLSTIARDISELKRTEREQTWMLRELDHRVKNNLALVGAIARQTAAGAKDVDSYVESLQRRLQALSRVHATLSMGSWGGEWGDTTIGDVVRRCLTPFQLTEPGRFEMSGDDVSLRSSEATPLGLAVFELAANAAKHGAWSDERGRVRIEWARNGATARLTWTETESGVVDDVVEGSGLRLVRDCIEVALGGAVQLHGETDRFEATLTFPLRGIEEQGREKRRADVDSSDHGRPGGAAEGESVV